MSSFMDFKFSSLYANAGLNPQILWSTFGIPLRHGVAVLKATVATWGKRLYWSPSYPLLLNPEQKRVSFRQKSSKGTSPPFPY